MTISTTVQSRPITYVGLVVWYALATCPRYVTDADVYAQDDDLLMIYTGTQYRIISIEQVQRVVSPRRHEWEEIAHEVTSSIEPNFKAQQIERAESRR